MNILVTGGAGYIGSVVSEELVKDGHQVVVYDSLYKGHREAVASGAKFVHADLAESSSLCEAFRDNKVEAVIHLAADSLVGESVQNPAKYYRNNVTVGLALLDAMVECGVRKIVFSSTAATYGEPEKQPIEEKDPTRPTNPYGETKLTFERALRWYEGAYNLHSASLRYFNAAGASETCGEHHDPETHLIPIILQAVMGKRPQVEIYGDDYATRDGTCVRDYIHVVDLARAHIAALSILGERSAVYNLGCGGDGYTVREVITMAEEVTGRAVPVRVGPRRPGDPAVLYASAQRLRHDLGWAPRRAALDTIVEDAWRWHSTRPHGFARPPR